MVWTYFDSWTAREAEIIVRGATPPSASQFRLLLLDGTTITRTMAKAAIVSSELLQLNGYTRQSYTPGVGAWDAGQLRYELPSVTLNFSATGASLQWSAAVLWADSVAISSKVFGAIDTGLNRITVTAHGLSNADPVAATTTNTLPDGLAPNTLYYAKSIDTNTVELYTDAALTTIVDLANSGNGTHYLRYAKGDPVLFANFATQLIGDGATQPVKLDWAFLTAGNVSGV